MLNISDENTLKLLRNCYADYYKKKPLFNKMYDYFKGNSDATKHYQMVTKRSNNKVNTNFIKKFIKEEVSYSVGNDITYISKKGNKQIVEDIDYYTSHWSEKHDSDLAKWMLTYGFAYELNYINKQRQFCSRIITPRNGYVFTDDTGNVIFFMHIFQKMFDANVYIDIYDDASIYHCDASFNQIADPTPHIFGIVPVSIAQVSEEQEDDTIYKDIKGLQDAYETNLSDISNEISDFRNAYLAISGFSINEQDIPKMKELGVIQIPNEKGIIQWLIKNINDGFIQNTLSTTEDKMYQLTSHINHNEKMQSNLSGVALRSRLISLEEKCKLNQKAIADCIKSRLQMLFIFLKKIEGKDYDFRDIQLRFTPNIPQDDLNTANIINTLGPDRLSTKTALGLLSFISNPDNEIKKIEEEQEANDQGEDLLNGGAGGGQKTTSTAGARE
jgi:SPP1 family phage portal protein